MAKKFEKNKMLEIASAKRRLAMTVEALSKALSLRASFIGEAISFYEARHNAEIASAKRSLAMTAGALRLLRRKEASQ